MNSSNKIKSINGSKLTIELSKEIYQKLINSPFFKFKLSHVVCDSKNDVSSCEISFNLEILNYDSVIRILNDWLLKNNLPSLFSFRQIETISNISLNELDVTKNMGVSIKENANDYNFKYLNYKNNVNRLMNRKLREKQSKDSFFMFEMKKVMNFSVPGSGKTATVIGMFAYLLENELVDKMVIVGPKNCFTSWISELEICLKNRVSLSFFQSTESLSKEDKFIKLKYHKNNILIFNYESLPTYWDILKPKIDEKTLLVFDEVHKVKRINGKYAKYCINISEKPIYKILMTGTPIPNGYIDIYNMLNILFGNNYKKYFKFNLNDLKKPNDFIKKQVNESIYPFFCRTTKKELEVPEPNHDILVCTEASEKENKIFKTLFSKYKNCKLSLFIRILQLESNPKMLLSKINKNDLNNFFDDEYEKLDYLNKNNFDFNASLSREFKHIVGDGFITTKTKKIIEYVKKITSENKSIIIWCIFIDTIRMLKEILDSLHISCEIIHGSISFEDRTKIINDFKNKKFSVLITNPHTLAESVSLHTVCHDAIYYEYSYNLVHLLQSKDRIHRLGLKKEDIIQWYFMMTKFNLNSKDYSIGDEVYKRLEFKEDEMMKAINNNILEEQTSDDTDLDEIFKKLYESTNDKESNE